MSEPSRIRLQQPASRRARRRAALLALALALPWLGGQGCSGDDDGGVLEEVCLAFTAAEAPAPGIVTTRLRGDSTCTTAALEIVATGPGLDDVWSLDTTVTFDADVVSWTGSSTAGCVLGSDGSEVAANIALTDSGVLTVGVTRVLAATGIDIPEDGGILVTLFFSPNTDTADSGALALGGDCLRSDGEPPPVIPDVTCSGGTFVVR